MSETTRKPEGYADLGDLSEDERITIIGRTVVERGKTVAVCVDDQPAKVARYIRKIRDRFPTIVVLSQSKGPARGIVTIKLGPQ
ncbi:hypothetical protein [Humibacter sp.]|uniref:hypothetical protein n=1 Tax=Humibacter sp. TaxID=1940291 RepID=UPI003F805E34